MTATELYKAGQLQEAIDAQIKEVKANAADNARRLFLFEMLAFAGEIDRATKQIDAVNYGDMELDVATLNYRKALDSEKLRRKLFADGQPPEFLSAPPDHVKLRLDALNAFRGQRHDEAAMLLSKAHDATPAVTGTLNDKPFSLLRDCDDLFGTVLEVFARGKYLWIPLEQVDSAAMNAPRFPRDLLWVPARLLMQDGQKGDVLLPALYPGSHEHPENAVKLGRLTDWKDLGGGAVLGVGSRTYLVDDDALPLLEWRSLEINAPPAPESVSEGTAS